MQTIYKEERATKSVHDRIADRKKEEHELQRSRLPGASQEPSRLSGKALVNQMVDEIVNGEVMSDAVAPGLTGDHIFEPLGLQAMEDQVIRR